MKSLTASGRMIDLSDPKPEDINLTDIAYGLCQPRFNGQAWFHDMSRPYTILDHSLLVSTLVPHPLRVAAYLHDAHEAYIGDITTPTHLSLPTETQADIEALAWRLDQAITDRFNLQHQFDDVEIKEADEIALWMERIMFMPVHSEWKVPGVPLGRYARHFIEPRSYDELVRRFIRFFADGIFEGANQ